MATVPDPSPPRTLAYRATRFSIIALTSWGVLIVTSLALPTCFLPSIEERAVGLRGARERLRRALIRRVAEQGHKPAGAIHAEKVGHVKLGKGRASIYPARQDFRWVLIISPAMSAER